VLAKELRITIIHKVKKFNQSREKDGSNTAERRKNYR